MLNSEFTWRFSNIEVDEHQRQISVAGKTVECQPRLFEVLLLLLRQAPAVVPALTILETVWPDRILHDGAVTNAISRIRKLIHDDQQLIIENRSKQGYRIVPAVTKSLARERSDQLQSLQEGSPLPNREHWTLTEQLGTGGYGEVWLATHNKTHDLRVIKFCRSPEYLSALKREVTIFRLLRGSLGDSIAVARIIDWQLDATPHFIELEYHGTDLSNWAKSKGGLEKVSFETRLDIARQLIEAVSRAHSIGVLHGDIKPRNVLVDERDGTCFVRICDFGVGSVLESDQILASGITMLGFTDSSMSIWNGTPMYMAPELFLGKPASIESDVFSLGVLLYQLTRGDWSPIASGWHADISDELLRSDIEDATAGDSHKRLSSARQLLDRLNSLPQRREALRAQRERQRSARESQEALERQRDRRPWVIALFMSMLLGIIALYLVASRANKEAATAREQRTVVAGINHQLSEIVRQANPDYGGRFDAKVVDAVVGSIPALRQNLGTAPLVESSIDEYMAETLASLGQPRLAAELYHRAVILNSQISGEDDPETEADQLREINSRIEFEDARRQSRIVHLLSGKMHAQLLPGDRRLWLADEVTARVYYKEGDSENALKSANLVIFEAGTPNNSEDWIELDRARAVKLLALGALRRCADVVKLGNAWLPHYESIYGVMGRPTLTIHQWLGFAENCVGAMLPGPNINQAKAISEERLAIDGFSQLVGADSEDTLKSLSTLAQILIDNGDFDTAIPMLQTVHQGNEKLYGPYSVWTLRPLTLIVYGLDCSGKHSEAAAQGRLLLKSAVDHLSSSDYIYREILLMTALAELHADQPDLASPLVEESKKLLAVDDPPPTQSDRAMGIYLSGMLAQERHDWQVAVPLLTEATDLLDASEGPNDVITLDAKARLLLSKAQFSQSSTTGNRAPSR